MEFEKTVIKVGQASGVIISDRLVIMSAHQLVDTTQTDLLLAEQVVPIARILFQGLFELDTLAKTSKESYTTIDVAIAESPIYLMPFFLPAYMNLNLLKNSGEVSVVGYPADSGLRIARGFVTSHRENYLGISLLDPVYPGMSGGGIFNEYDELIGIHSTNDSDDPLFSHAVYLAKINNYLKPFV